MISQRPRAFMATSFDHVRKGFAQNIRVHRDEGKLSQEELALRADIDRTYVNQTEPAIGNPALQVLYKLSSALGVDVDQFIRAKYVGLCLAKCS